VNPHSLLATENERQAFGELIRAYEDYVSSAGLSIPTDCPALVKSEQLAQLDSLQAPRPSECAI